MIQEQLSPSMWDMKPWWCQPWSIILTGVILPILAWCVSHSLWLLIPFTGVILAWWFIFLYAVPKSYTEYVKAEYAKTEQALQKKNSAIQEESH